MKPIPDSKPRPPVLDRPGYVGLYEQMVRVRRFELAAQKNYKAGRMPGFIHLYLGEEAVAAGVCAHLRREDWVTSTHRGHGHALAKGVSCKALMAELYGRAGGCCGGRGGSMHLFDREAGLFGTNGIVGGGIAAAVGAALSARVRKTSAVAVAFFGDGAVNHGAFHEGLNLAAINQAPVIFACENNLYATATPFKTATRNTSVASRGAAYGLPGMEVDGNDVLAVWQAAGKAIERARNGDGPTLLEFKTYRTAGHHEGDPIVGTYRTQEELDAWKARCPILRFRKWLLAEGFADETGLAEIESRIEREINEAVAWAESSPMPDPRTANDHALARPINPPAALASGSAPAPNSTEINYLEAVRDGIAEEMRHDPHILYFGEGIGERGGSFAHTKGLWKEFTGNRVIDTPISELGFTGAAAGASATGCRSVADLMFIDFLFEAASQVILQAAKWRYMSNGQMSAPVVIRAGMGAIKNAGPHHSGCYYPMYAHCPGILVAVPSNPADAKGLIKTALRASDPVLFLEHKLLFGMKGLVPPGEYYIPFGRANVLRQGQDLTIVSCGEYVNRCVAAAGKLAAQGLSCEVIDLRTIVPLDVQTIVASVSKTGRLLVVDEAHPMCGIGAEIAAAMMEEAFDELDAPVGRLHPDPVTQPFSPALENEVVVTVEKIIAAAQDLAKGKAPVPRRPKGPPVTAETAIGADRAPRSPGTKEPVAVAAPPTEPSAGVSAKPAATVPVMMPNQDLTVTEGTVVRWVKHVGDAVALNEVIVEVETAKAVVPVESPAAGTLAEVLAQEGAVIRMGLPLAAIRPRGPGDA
jgi:2-oxoisovalerate dehydrogenase E1 component